MRPYHPALGCQHKMTGGDQLHLALSPYTACSSINYYPLLTFTRLTWPWPPPCPLLCFPSLCKSLHHLLTSPSFALSRHVFTTLPTTHCLINSVSRARLANYKRPSTLWQASLRVGDTYMNRQTGRGGWLSGGLVTLPSLISGQGLIDFPLSVYATPCPLHSCHSTLTHMDTSMHTFLRR